MQPLLEQVFEKNHDNLKIVFKHLPLRMHKQALPAARAAVAAQKQGKFWQMHDALFGIKKITPKKIEEAAQKIGLDMDRFKKDLKSPEVEQQIRKDVRDAQKAGVSGTPTMFINGHRVVSRDPVKMQEMIDRELSRGKKGK